jgi:hypothetical protein
MSCRRDRGVVAFNDSIEPVGLTLLLTLADSSQSLCFSWKLPAGTDTWLCGLMARELLADVLVEGDGTELQGER